MSESAYRQILANPTYQELKQKRGRFGWLLTVVMFAVYYGYVLLIAFDRELLAQKVGAGVTTLGIPVGLGIIIFTVVITGIYVRRANGEFDAMTDEVLREGSRRK